MYITTNDINEAVTALKTGNCTGLDASSAKWGDTELFEIIKCMAAGFCVNLITLKLPNNFSREATLVLYAIIGPRNVARALVRPNAKNPQ